MEQVTLSAEILAVRYRADDFAVLAALTDDAEEIVLTGPLAHVHEGESVEVAGVWREHARHGRQFHVAGVRIAEATSEAALVAYLSSVKHVGPKGAAWLLGRHGAEKLLAAIDADPRGCLSEVPGIGRGRIDAAVRSWEDQTALRAVRLFLETHGVPAAVAARVYRAFGAGTIELLRDDPYALIALDGIGFATADALARALGTPADSPGRLDAGVVHALHEAELDGHCHLPRPELLERAGRLLDADVSGRLAELEGRGLIVVEDERVSEARMHAIERRLARHVRELLEGDPVLELEVPDEPPSEPGSPTPDQWAAVQAVARSRLSILTGLPGTGKTATMRAIVDLARAQRRRVRLCAPTGKAARRLAESTGAEATTIHRLLEFVPGEGFTRDEQDPIPGADLLIVDEASMLDVRLAGALLDAVGPRTHVLLVGDVDQLAPVGPGRVLEDLIDSGAVPSTRLTQIFRQAARSLIVRAAHAINAGEPPPVAAGDDDLRDFFFIEREGAQAIFEQACGLASERLPRHYDLDPASEVQVLSPMHRGPAGIDALNTELRSRLNPSGAPVPGTQLRLGDAVIQTRNNHELEFMNGERAVVVHHDPEEERVFLACDDGRRLSMPVAETGTLRLAYCTSIHKAQGSQAPAIVVVLSSQHHVMLTRNLIYTAVTRASTVCVLVGERRALETALRRTDARRRHTRLAQLVVN